VLAEESEWLADVGMPVHKITIADKEHLVCSLVVHYLFNRYVKFNFLIDKTELKASLHIASCHLYCQMQ